MSGSLPLWSGDLAFGATFEERSARAALLAEQSLAGAGPLAFAAGLYRAQAAVADALAAMRARSALSGRLESDADRVIPLVVPIASYAKACGPKGLAIEASTCAEEDREHTRTRLLAYWLGDEAGGAVEYLSRAMLRPYVETLARAGVRPERPRPPGGRACRVCGGVPFIGELRGGSDAEGAARFLHCGLCGCTWAVNRIHCPACSEESPERLPNFHADAHPGARVEACDTCRTYVKSIDRSLDARRIPEVDDLTSLPMDLWAIEQGYSRIAPGLAGV